jgi:hypothetical protein
MRRASRPRLADRLWSFHRRWSGSTIRRELRAGPFDDAIVLGSRAAVDLVIERRVASGWTLHLAMNVSDETAFVARQAVLYRTVSQLGDDAPPPGR